MKVFKFGGASVKNADAVRNVANIIGMFPNDDLTIVVSAMGKTTNALEAFNHAIYNETGEAPQLLKDLIEFHHIILADLLPTLQGKLPESIQDIFDELEHCISREAQYSFAHQYDQIVSKGEMISTRIVAEYLNTVNINAEWLDIRNCILTDHHHQEGKVDWVLTEKYITENLLSLFQKGQKKVIVTQGFIGASTDGFTVTLGREGSDYSASIIAHCLNAKEVTIWKDVPGVLNADPKWFDNTVKLDKLSYQDAIELAYYGASVIHPKTIQPLKSKDIKLHVKSFLHPKNEGTVVGEGNYDSLIPSFIFKMNQVMISVASKDFSFIAEDYLHTIFGIFAEQSIKINLMQNSAISFLICIDNDPNKISLVKETLEQQFKVDIENDLELITIRYYDSATIERVTKNKDIVLSQKGKRTIQLVVKDLGNSITI